MFTRGFVCLTLLIILNSISIPSSQAQATQRWLADPALITNGRFPDQSRSQRFDNIIDMALVDEHNGWAVSYASILHLEDRFWKRYASLPERYMAHAISLEDADHGWIVGEAWQGNDPFSANVAIMRYAAGQWFPSNDVRHKDGSLGPMAGHLNDIAALPGFAMAIGYQHSPNLRGNIPLVLVYNGTEWRDITPDEWTRGSLRSLSMISANEGWLVGTLGQSSSPVIMHYRNGNWIEEQIIRNEDSFINLNQITMRDNSDGWAVYTTFNPNAACSQAGLLRYQGGVWLVQQNDYAALLVLGLIPGTNRGWATLTSCAGRDRYGTSKRMAFNDGILTPDPNGTTHAPTVYALLSDDVQWAASGSHVLRYSNELLPTAPITGAKPGARFFPETGHSIEGEFRRYYEQHGIEFGDRGISARESLALFGYPISEPFDEINPDTSEIYRVQYFERARMELHPENPESYRVLLGRLAFAARGYATIPNPDSNPAPPQSGCQRFPETGYDICAPFLSFWKRSGGLAAFGLPLDFATEEPSKTDGHSYLTLWLERERMEHHGELVNTPYEILLGLLGSEDLRLRGYLP